MKNNGIHVMVVLLSSLISACKASSFYCASTQFLEYEKTGIITCMSENPFYGIYWYNSTDSANNPPFLYRDDSQGNENTHSMKGYEISESGSLVIKNVSLRDEHLYRAVLIYDESSGHIEIRDINVIIIVKPASNYPVIDLCSRERFCFSTLGKSFSSLKCSVEDSRPAVSLQWSFQTVWNKTDLFSDILITNGTKWFTSSIQTAPSWPTRLAVLVCKAVYPPGILVNDDSFILIENQTKEVELSKRRLLQVELGFPVTLICPSRRKHVLKWEKIYENGTQMTLGFACLSKGSMAKALHGYQIAQNGNLIVRQSHIKHEGLYRCAFSDGLNDGAVEVNVILYANPEPAFPIVRGCEKQALRYCVLRVQIGGILTCSLHRVRPVVQLELGLFTEFDNDLISFSDQQVVTSNDDGTFDITVTSVYHLQHKSERRLTVQCRTVGSSANLSTVFDLHFTNVEEVMATSPSIDGKDSGKTFNLLWLFLLLGFCLVIVAVVVCMILFLAKRKRSHLSHSEQVMPMLRSSHLKTNKSAVFTQQLRKKYGKLYNAILPVPFLRNNKYCVNSIFVESTVELQTPHKQFEWERLKSYNDLFALIDSDPKRMLVLGEPGMGKSTLTLQLAYDWCNEEEFSPMKNVDILILLRLRQLRGTHSIYDSIKLLLLPTDTKLTTQDVESILQECNSVYVVLDGFDECVDQEINAYSDVENIIKGDMFQNFHVLVCTRPSCLPKELPPKTSNVRMKGFDDNAQEQYIQKTISMNSSESTRNIRDKLKENTILLDFCEIPLFFVMYAHMTYEVEITYDFNSVTSFFRYIITCCFSHYENKLTVKSSLLSTDFKENYRPISKIAFNGLFGERPKIIWDRKEIESELGSEIYNKYTQIGILVEEEVLEIINKPGTSSAGHIFYKTEVRFYHKLFCEWYAAHYISDLALCASEADFLSVLHKVYDINQEYVFRFACGINPTCADKIIKYLTERREEDRLAILCILEKTGNIETIKKEISCLCEKQISLSANDPRIVQRSTTQLLEIASKNKVIAISKVCLRSCFKNVDLAKEHVVLTSGITIPKLGTISELEVFAEEKEFDVKEMKDIMSYCILCGNIGTLRLKYCLLPECIQADTTVLKGGNPAICVIWAPNLFRNYTLDNQSGIWRDKEGRYLDETGYLEEVASFRARKT
ncbi:NLR family CARD domain-containing protein 4 [Holothuria leucospilota]|uniref:NLR family CARD domain-containing protein 4 n=1 Tax=Holothuria leucospilota TaxID=206669 RepID=A0A9Q1BX20_HOLLE|nr:NLR family CARD domain-containing protein 4 [Holothuria leucospilota]